MFFALDESFSSTYTCIGLLCVPITKLPSIESEFILNRIEEKLWGEVKWCKLTKSYYKKYQRIVTNYLQNEGVTFHSWVYENPTKEILRLHYDEDPNKVIYKQAYLLIRSVIRKCLNTKATDKFYIVPDESGPLGKNQYTITQDLLTSDPNIKPRPKIEFCTPGNSVSCGAMQIADICTGATRYKYEKVNSEDPVGASDFVELLESINSNVTLDFSFPNLPKLDQFKIHHCLAKFS